MKVLLYEPENTGHRPVILRYTIKIFEQMGIEWTQGVKDLTNSPLSLVMQAREKHCNIIYVLTVDGKNLFTWTLSLLARVYNIRVICTYYLFNNLCEGWKSWAWRLLLATGNIDRIHISDEHLKSNRARYPKQARFLPDPWDPDEFPEWTQISAREHLQIASDATVFLMFGALDKKKGADIFLEASRRLTDNMRIESETVFFLAGEMTQSVYKVFEKCKEGTNKHVRWIADNRRIPESEVSLHYYAADYIVCAYPAYFRVSSNTVTRALAASRPVIVPSHGATGAMVTDNACGMLFRTGDDLELAATLAAAVRLKNNEPSRYEKMCKNGHRLAHSRRLEVYSGYLRLSIESLIKPV